MFDREIKRFKTPPELPSVTTTPESQNPSTKRIEQELIKTKYRVESIGIKTPDELLSLINENPTITCLKWVTFPFDVISFALYSDPPDEHGFGGLTIPKEEFENFKSKLPSRVRIIYIGK